MACTAVTHEDLHRHRGSRSLVRGASRLRLESRRSFGQRSRQSGATCAMLRAMTTNAGRFVWYELLTTDPAAAIAFYSDVVGWKTQPFGSGTDYTMWVGEQGPLGGVTLLPEEAKKMGASPYWQSNVEVADVDETAAKVKKLGGQVHHLEDVPTVGRFAVIGDPQGAVISV